MAGFRADIGTDVQAPDVTPVPRATGDDVSDALNIAGFGLNLYGQYKQQQEQERKIERQKNLLGDAQKISEDLFSALDQKDMSLVEQQNFLNKRVGAYANPIERQFIMDRVAQTMTTGLYAEARKEKMSDEQLLDSNLNALDPSVQGLLFKGRNIADMSIQEKKDIMTEYRKLAAKQQQTEIAVQDFQNNPNIRTFRNAMSSEFQMTMTTTQQQLATLMEQVQAAGSSPELVDYLGRSKDNLINTLSQVEGRIDALYTDAAKGLSEKERTALRKEYEDYKKTLKSYKDNLNQMDEEQFKNVSNLAQLMKDRNEVELQESFPKLLKMKEVYGTGFNAVTSLVIARNPQLQNITGDALASGIEQILGTAAGAASLANVLDVEQLNQVVSEGNLMDYASSQRENAATLQWNAAKILIESPETIEKLPPNRINNLGIKVVQILDRADELGDEDSIRNASALLSSPAMDTLIAKLPEEQQTVISRYVARSAGEVVKRRSAEALNTGAYQIDYNQQTGKFFRVVDETKLDPLSGGIERSRGDARFDSLNTTFENSAKSLVKYHPAIDNIEQAKEYILSVSRPDLIRTQALDEDRKKAIQANTSLKAIQERAELAGRVEGFYEDTRSISDPAVRAVEEASQEPQETEETKLLKALRSTKDPEERLAILEELDKLDG